MGKRKRLNVEELTPRTCKGFVNGNCSMNCPNAKLESACDRWDLNPSDFGMEYIDCKECYMSAENCTCEEDCYVYGNKDYCPKASNNRKELE